MNAQKTFEQKHWEVEQKACHWLAEANEALEKGNLKRDAFCMKKAQYWLDRLNRLEGN